MTPTTDKPATPGPAAAPEGGAPAEAIAALRQQLAVLEEQVAAVNRQQAALRAALNDSARFPDAGPAADNGSVGPATLQRCAGDVVRVLREVGRPLGTLEILEELSARHLGWRESTVRHVLADLKNEGIVREGDRDRALSYSLAKP